MEMFHRYLNIVNQEVQNYLVNMAADDPGGAGSVHS